jgi:hypothetical protein
VTYFRFVEAGIDCEVPLSPAAADAVSLSVAGAIDCDVSKEVPIAARFTSVACKCTAMRADGSAWSCLCTIGRPGGTS